MNDLLTIAKLILEGLLVLFGGIGAVIWIWGRT
jgi:hypothetical protein